LVFLTITEAPTPTNAPTDTPTESPTEALTITEAPTTFPLMISISKGNKIGTIFNPPNDFILTFQIQPLGTHSDFNSILRFTSTNNDCCNYGDRWVGMWFPANSYEFHLAMGTPDDGNQYMYVDGIEGNKDNSIKIEANGVDIAVYINDSYKGSLSNENRPLLNEVNVYASDAFYVAAKGTIKNLVFLTITEAPTSTNAPTDTPTDTFLPTLAPTRIHSLSIEIDCIYSVCDLDLGQNDSDCERKSHRYNFNGRWSS